MLDKWKKRIREKRFRAQVKCVGSGLDVFGKHINIHNPEKLIAGNNFKINNHVVIIAKGGVHIGDNVTLSDGSKLISSGYDLDLWKRENLRVHKNEEIVIGDNVWICANAVICPGVTISGDHVVVATGAVVTEDIKEDNSVWGGVPARIIKRL